MYECLVNYINDNNIDFEYEKYTKDELNIINEFIKTGEYNISEEDDNNKKIFNMFGLYNYSLNKNEIAKKYYKIAIGNINSDSDACYNLALLYEEEENFDDSKYYYLKAIELSNHRKSYINYAEILDNEERIKEALYYYQRVVNLYSNNKDVLFEYGKFLLKNKEYNNAEEVFLKILNLNNNNSDTSVLFYFALTLKENNKIEEAKKYFLKCIEKNESYSMIEYAIILYKENNIIEAKEYLLKSIEYNNENGIFKYLELFKNQMENYIDFINISLSLSLSISLSISIEIKNIIEKFINKYAQNKDFLILYNKIKYYSKIDNCKICFNDNVKNIPLNCMCHIVCINCYYNLYDKKCPFCRL